MALWRMNQLLARLTTIAVSSEVRDGTERFGEEGGESTCQRISLTAARL